MDFDTLYFSGKGITIDLTSINDSIITGVEKIVLIGNRDNSIKL